MNQHRVRPNAQEGDVVGDLVFLTPNAGAVEGTFHQYTYLNGDLSMAREGQCTLLEGSVNQQKPFCQNGRLFSQSAEWAAL